jgi:serine/threonine protein kinase
MSRPTNTPFISPEEVANLLTEQEQGYGICRQRVLNREGNLLLHSCSKRSPDRLQQGPHPIVAIQPGIESMSNNTHGSSEEEAGAVRAATDNARSASEGLGMSGSHAPREENGDDNRKRLAASVEDRPQDEKVTAAAATAEAVEELPADNFGYTHKMRTSEGTHTSERKGGRNKRAQQHAHHQPPPFGLPVSAEHKGDFPAMGSILGHFFCLGKLGAGTFSSIHKCINMNYWSNANAAPRRLAAAKVELSSFSQSGVLEAEAMILEFLHKTLPTGTVPVYMGHYKSGDSAAILMEYLPGQDMHHLRETVMEGASSRRISVKDAVYLTADVMLPLLEKMHNVGVVHRDVKPSNCVRAGVDPEDRTFCLVDFGLSKSIVVPQDSELADTVHPWDEKDWLRPKNYNGSASFRRERTKADFRGTSMYASLRVHQMKDYCRRDDMWSVLYVFCDLVSGGLPWMSYAAIRDRNMCRTLKETIHGDGGKPDETEQMLMGDEYHVTLFRNAQKTAAGETNRLHPVPEPLALSKDTLKVDALRKAFGHLAALNFLDKPDYALIRQCIHTFLDDESTHPPVRPVDWHNITTSATAVHRRGGKRTPTWNLVESIDPAEVTDAFYDFDEASESPTTVTDPSYLIRLPLEMQFRYHQVTYHVRDHGQTPMHVILRDWLQLVLPLLYDEWDAKRFEDGGHRTTTDGYRRETYLQLLRKCVEFAQEFGSFQSADCVYAIPENAEEGMLGKKRKITADDDSHLATIARALYGLGHAIQLEQTKRSPPPKQLSF